MALPGQGPRRRRGSVAEATPATGVWRLYDHRPSQSVVHKSVSAPDLLVDAEEGLPGTTLRSQGSKSTAQALKSLWRQQQRREFLRPTEGRPDRPVSSAGSLAGSSPSLPEARRPDTGLGMKGLERRCDNVMSRLVADSGGHWGRVQEVQSRLQDQNRVLTAQSYKSKATLQSELFLMRAEPRAEPPWASTSSGSASHVPSMASTAPSTLQGGFWSKAAPPYETASKRFFSLHDREAGVMPAEEAEHFADLQRRASEKKGLGRWAAITEWGTNPVFYIAR